MSHLDDGWEWYSRLVRDVLDTYLVLSVFFCIHVIDTLTNHLSSLTITYHLSFSTVCPSSLLFHLLCSILPNIAWKKRKRNQKYVFFSLWSSFFCHFSEVTTKILWNVFVLWRDVLVYLLLWWSLNLTEFWAIFRVNINPLFSQILLCPNSPGTPNDRKRSCFWSFWYKTCMVDCWVLVVLACSKVRLWGKNSTS